MNLIADENVGKLIVEALRQDGHNVFSVSFSHDGQILAVRSFSKVNDKKYKLAVTNAHVTGKQNTIEIYFPAPDEKSELIKDRNFYLQCIS